MRGTDKYGIPSAFFSLHASTSNIKVGTNVYYVCASFVFSSFDDSVSECKNDGLSCYRHDGGRRQFAYR